MSAKRRYFHRQAIIWLSLSALLFLLWLVLWLGNDDAQNRQVRLATTSTPADLMLPDRIETLDELKIEVPPISFDVITRDLRSYPSEFKDRLYFEEHKSKWTVQVMDVAEHKLIVDYLENRPDRKKFAYFRYTDSNHKLRYLLTYGVMNSFQEAMGAAKLIDFRLPNSARTLPEEMSRYLALIDSYERPVDEEQIEELALPPKIQLSETETLVEAAPAPTQEPTSPELQKEAEKEAELAVPPTINPDAIEPKPDKPKDKISEPKPNKSKSDVQAESKLDKHKSDEPVGLKLESETQSAGRNE